MKKKLKFVLIIPAFVSLFFIQIESEKDVKATWEIIKENNLVGF